MHTSLRVRAARGNSGSLHIYLQEHSSSKGSRFMSGPGPGAGETFFFFLRGNGCRANHLFAPDTGASISVKLHIILFKKSQRLFLLFLDKWRYSVSFAVFHGRQGESAGCLKVLQVLAVVLHSVSIGQRRRQQVTRGLSRSWFSNSQLDHKSLSLYLPGGLFLGLRRFVLSHF